MAALLAAFAAMLACVAAPAHAQLSNLGAGQTGRPLSVCVLRAHPGDDPARLIRAPQRFDCTAKQTSFGPGDYWVISNDIGQRSRSRRPLVARIGSVWQQSLTLHVLYSDGRLATMHDDNRGITRRIQLGAIVEHPLPRYSAKVQRLMWKAEGSANLRGIVVGPRLATQAESQRSNLAMAAIYAGFGGLALALLVYNLALWASLRYRFQLAYCLMVAALLAYAFTSSGALAWVWPDIANNDRLRLNYLLLTLACASALLFARAFFEEHVFGPRLRLLIRATVTLLVATGLFFVLFAPVGVNLVDRVYSWVFASVIVSVVATLWSAWRSRSNYLWVFAIAWALPILAACMRIFANLGLIRWNFWLDNSTILSMSAEALISSVAIAYRIRLLSRERDSAIAAEAVARRLADTDPLTGLLNRRAFLASAIGREGPQTLLILDLDHFKQVNDTLGHDGGDEVLRVVARTLRALAPPGTLVARIGGEEFAVVTGMNQPVDPNTVLTRVRATRMPFDLRVTASIGTATGTLATEADWKALYRAADTALFAAKSAGRDRARAATLAA
ncbi:GGDEF domain-containing protein [Sphingomonas sp. BT-65]|uniref:sensor domain-containing diguanylate cyclase n=1 Tax=Sphingomonas sp. BT-65 TaxID=2989821 RepID=UPI0022365EA1|nr:diguanylate cyclase [Sphingomonas sp. BT-65]MCW4461414.1 GGDEF domain-containing protein [Sphingomonas sp. BT-65]